MARWWFTRWFNACVNEDHESFVPLGASLTVDAALRHNSAQSAGSLYQLPADLLFMVCQYLTRAEVVTLMLCCARFWHSRTGSGVFAKVWKQMTLPAGKDLGKMAARFYVLKMLEYDDLLQKGSPSKYCCWLCMKAHERQAFSRKEFKKTVDLKPTQDFYPEQITSRTCLLAKRYIWFGVCGEMSFVELRHAIATQERINGNISLRDGTYFLERVLDCEARLFVYHFRLGLASDIRSFAFFTKHARAVNSPLCPHLRLGDQEVIELYRRPWLLYSCKHCTTTVQVDISTLVKVRVYRYVGSLGSPTDPVWMAQSYQTRHRRLKARGEAFNDWHRRVYGSNGRIARGKGFKKFNPKRIPTPFKGAASCTPEWPEGQPVLVQPEE